MPFEDYFCVLDRDFKTCTCVAVGFRERLFEGPVLLCDGVSVKTYSSSNYMFVTGPKLSL